MSIKQKNNWHFAQRRPHLELTFRNWNSDHRQKQNEKRILSAGIEFHFQTHKFNDETYSQRRTRSGPYAYSSCVLLELRPRIRLYGKLGMEWRLPHRSWGRHVAAKHQGAAEAPIHRDGGDVGIALQTLGSIHKNSKLKIKDQREFWNKISRKRFFF